MVISVFGSSAPVPGSPGYEEARTVGRLLAQAGFAVATGGYCGTMEAVSRGAAEAGGRVIGVTCDQIEVFRPLGPNEFVTDEIRYATLQERVQHLVRENEGMIVLPGGIGTLSELALAWSLLQVGEISPRPVVLLGEIWQNMLHAFFCPDFIRPQDMDMLFWAESPEAAVSYIID
ncbi:MAG: LOG family protein [Chloroflexota bacterium]